ncbi:hypothetical protein HYT05_04785, partial [Candidatus Kaiserbacteria bacterium]|nr:hypothetical protein [Candidatus Kaiserbacteria bacterium]
MKRHKKKVLVIVHDAGGAEVIGAYLHKQVENLTFRAYGNGPALAIFKRLHLPIRQTGPTRTEMDALMHRHADIDFVVVGAPGWMTTTEINALEAAKHAGLKVVVYMDSW